jgi:hypothetical protein
MTQDQVYVPRTRSQLGLPLLKPEGESHLGASISKEIMNELHEAIGDSPIGAVFGSGSYLVRHCELKRDEPKWRFVSALWLAHIHNPQCGGPETLSEGQQPFVQ